MKILYVGGAILALIVTYFLITAYWSTLMVPAMQTASAATDNTTYPFSSAVIRSAPLWLYLVPAVVVVVAVVIKLRERPA